MTGKTLAAAAAAAGVSERMARRWQSGALPSTAKAPRTWRTREDPFGDVWETEVVPQLVADTEGRLQALTLFRWLCRRHPGRFPVGQLRTLQRRVREWRAQDGPDREVYVEHERGHAPLGSVGVPAQELAREGVHTRGGFPGPDSPDNGHPGIEPPLRDDEPVRGGTLHQFDRVVDLADDDGRAVGGRRKWPARKAAASARPVATCAAIAGLPVRVAWARAAAHRRAVSGPGPPGPQTASPVPGAGRPYAVPRRTRRRGGAVWGAAVSAPWGRRRAGAACAR